MKVRYYLDPVTGLPHIQNHAVTEKEVEEVLRGPGEDRPAREGSRTAIGQTAEGRYLRIIYVPDSQPGSIFVISAYDLIGKLLTGYKEEDGKKDHEEESFSTGMGRRTCETGSCSL